MIITVQGRILDAMPAMSGISQNTGKEWKSQQYILAVDDNPEDYICFQVFGAERIASYDLKRNKRVAVTLEIESKEWNGKWMTNMSCKQCWIMPPKVEIEQEKQISSNDFNYN